MNNSFELIDTSEQASFFKDSWQQVCEICKWIAGAPRSIKAASFICSVVMLIEAAHFSSTGLSLYRTITEPNSPEYGPVINVEAGEVPYYSFNKVGPSFYGNLPLWRLSELTSKELATIFVQSVPKSLAPRLKRYIHIALSYAQKYHVDPLWVVSIMWVESHFNPGIQSSVKATGLMQIMPGTSHYLNRLMNRNLDKKLARELTKDPKHNVQLGVFYLKRLLRSFSGNYVYATVAYNMGPGYTKRRLRRGLGVGTKNIYLDKVRRAYNRFNSQVRRHFSVKAPRYINTYVVNIAHKENQFFPGSLSFFWDKLSVSWSEELVFLEVDQNKSSAPKKIDII